ncbi:UNVERIFIED_CONTAM: hypothetical protein Scaly_0091900 [Sesamum calycinum]|uniref:Endoplasmic reticulum transmembrane protein n=1 Tax=Sesamum calycinum TaxID=2727403 RepID=A0AAW2SWD0_9LAMI
MALEWVVLGYAAGAEAIMLLLLTVPGLDPLRKGLITVTRSLLKPFLSVVPFCLFLLMDIYWKYENRPSWPTLPSSLVGGMENHRQDPRSSRVSVGNGWIFNPSCDFLEVARPRRCVMETSKCGPPRGGLSFVSGR